MVGKEHSRLRLTAKEAFRGEECLGQEIVNEEYSGIFGDTPLLSPFWKGPAPFSMGRILFSLGLAQSRGVLDSRCSGA